MFVCSTLELKLMPSNKIAYLQRQEFGLLAKFRAWKMVSIRHPVKLPLVLCPIFTEKQELVYWGFLFMSPLLHPGDTRPSSEWIGIAVCLGEKPSSVDAPILPHVQSKGHKFFGTVANDRGKA